MSEETENHNDGTWSGLKKTIIGTLSTAVLGAGTWLTTTFFNAEPEVKEETKTEQAAPATTTIIKERVVEKPVKEEKKKEEPKEEAPW